MRPTTIRHSLGFAAVLALLPAAGCWTAAASAAQPEAPAASEGKLMLSAKDLYAGFEARRVLLDKDGSKLIFDARAVKLGKDAIGTVTTDVIDLAGEKNGLASGFESATAVEVELAAEVPEGASVKVETRSGARFFDQSDWTPWKDLGGLKGKVADLKGRYLQVRATLKAGGADKLPALASLALRPEITVQKIMLVAPAAVTENKAQTIVRSPVDFKYERLDQEKLARFRKENDLDGVVAGKYDEEIATPELRKIDKEMKGAGEDFLQLVRLMDWVGHCTNDRTQHPEKSVGYYDWDIDKVFKLVEVEKDGKKVKQPTIYGHCMSYSEVLVTAAAAMGFAGSRHMCMVGFREASHEIADIWVPSLGKWVYFDPSLTNYYFDKETKVPLNLIEMHKVVADAFVPEGKDMHWWMVRGSDETRARVKAVGGKKPIGSRLGRWCYGAPMKPDYDWGWSHGYLAAGFVQMTPRNDFHSEPKANPKAFENGPGYAGYPNWVDDKTPPKRGASNYFTRMRDFYWTLDQAGMKLTRTGEDAVSVELGNSMPFFKKYAVKVDGKEVADVKSPFAWQLKAGENKLEVAPVDEFGKAGLVSSVTVKLGK
ncbi:MAG TPA: hypothetical protein PK280_10725 [Planctomycetota bacterium]|nr:hypothetical protein [Planctomycetota bacterium]